MCSGGVSSSCSTIAIRRVTLVANSGDKLHMLQGPDCDYDTYPLTSQLEIDYDTDPLTSQLQIMITTPIL